MSRERPKGSQELRCCRAQAPTPPSVGAARPLDCFEQCVGKAAGGIKLPGVCLIRAVAPPGYAVEEAVYVADVQAGGVHPDGKRAVKRLECGLIVDGAHHQVVLVPSVVIPAALVTVRFRTGYPVCAAKWPIMARNISSSAAEGWSGSTTAVSARSALRVKG